MRPCLDWVPEGNFTIGACPVNARGALRPLGLMNPDNTKSPFYFYSSAVQPPLAGGNACTGAMQTD